MALADNQLPTGKNWKDLYMLLSDRSETKIMVTGVAMTVLLILLLILCLPWDPEVSHHLLKLSILHFISGRAAGISYGYAIWPSASWIVIPINLYLETLVVLLSYPLFVFSLEKLVIFKFLQYPVDSVRKAAVANQKWVKRFGIIGLFAFVWLPFWMTGPLVGCIIGYLLHLRIWVNLTIVLSGTYVAIICWAFFLKGLQDSLKEYSVYAPVVIVAAVVLVTLFLHIIHRINQNKKKD